MLLTGLVVFLRVMLILAKLPRRLMLRGKTAAKSYFDARATADNAASVLDSAKEKLVTLAKHEREQGSGVLVTRYWKPGSIDYEKIPELKGADLEQYRGPGGDGAVHGQ